MSNAPEQATLLFIPDISGFTQFVNHTEITHSQHIIQELLEALIDANEIGMTVSEIEGDAVLFYRDGKAPTAAELLTQVQRMYVNFHALLRRYDTHRICQCGACSTASGLSLKFVIHYGIVSKSQIKDHSKLFGRDVIVAHRLLKNSVEGDEYVLLTHELIKACTTWVEIQQVAWAEPVEGEDAYDFGQIGYCHVPLQPLRAHVPEPTIEDYSLSGAKVQVLSQEAVIDAPTDMVFDVLSDLTIRHEWQVGLKGSDRFNSRISQNGSTHRCVINNSEKDPFVVSHGFETGEDYITFTDTEQKQGWSSVYVLHRLGPESTRLEMHMLLKRKPGAALIFRLFMKKKMAKMNEQSMANLNAYCQVLLRDGSQHTNHIVLKAAA